MNLTTIPIPDLALLDTHLGGRLRAVLYQIVGAHLEPTIDVVREKHDGRSRWLVVLQGIDGQGKVRREERFEIALGARYERVIGVAVQIHVRAYLEDLRAELSVIYGEEFHAEDEVTAPWFAPRREPPS